MPPFSEDPELEAQVRARLGTTLKDKYTLDAVLGIGGMAAVYSATHRNGREVAVKLLHPHLSMNPDARGRFAREGLVANKVRHPGVVAVLDDDVTADGAAFLVMELLEGSTLEELWEKHSHALPLPAVVAVGVALLDILGAAHGAGVVHRDIKPANVFLTNAWQVKILDFGISRLGSIQSATSTQTGMMLGSPAFMAPEQALGRIAEIDGRTDLFSTAASLFTLLSGQYVHEGSSGQEMLIRAATVPVRSLAAAMPSVPGLITAVVDRALHFRREERWGTAAEMSVALSEAARASFGEEPSVRAFAPLIPMAASARLPTPMPARAGSAPPPLVATQLTSSTSGLLRHEPDGARRRRAFVLGGVAGLGLLVGFAAVAARLSRSHAQPDPALGIVLPRPPPSATSPDGPGAAAHDPPAAPIAVSASATTSVADGDLPPLVAPPVRPPVPAPTHPGARSASTKPAAPLVSATTRAPSTFLPPPPAPAADPCNPPYRYDFFGNKVLKPGCS